MESESEVFSLKQFSLDMTIKLFLDDPERLLHFTKVCPNKTKRELAEACSSALVAFRNDCNHILKRKFTHKALEPVLNAKEHFKIPPKYKAAKNALSFKRRINNNLPSVLEEKVLNRLTAIMQQLA